MNELPKEPGPYWWRQTESEEWHPVLIVQRHTDLLINDGNSWMFLRVWRHLQGDGEWVKMEEPGKRKCAACELLVREAERMNREIAILRNPEEEPGECVWKYDDGDFKWDTACGEAWVFTEGSIAENNVRFCHKCGRRVKEGHE